MKKSLNFLLIMGLFAGCGTIKSIGKQTSSAILLEGSKEIEQEANWEVFRSAAIPNIKTVEGLLYADPDNLKLLGLMVKGYAGVGFGIHEVEHSEEKFKDNGEKYHQLQAIASYTKSIEYGLIYLGLKGIDSKFLFQNMLNSEALFKEMDSRLGTDDEVTVFYLAQSWGSLINLQRTDVSILAQMPLVKNLMDWVCDKNPKIENGACSLFYGLYELSRPRMLGGDPAKGKKILQDYMKAYPYNMLAKVTFLEFVVMKEDDKKLYRDHKTNLDKDFGEFARQRNFGKNLNSRSAFAKHPELNLLNAIAEKKFQIIRRYDKSFYY
ncbi:MAG: hypothetical protein JNM93_13505 [Bacteriovoracaceae bacterium]|nr:hypothetical protein [Bacteriovoracaceae bacterium]